ncbi:MAG: hypothetical protein CVU96_01410 [Firmicutes bacterium HGW-Firmicutes-20]|jgi:DNA-binding transcriptional MerR regulator|nr:MAG: hypothetical protein CVV00_10670 [Firmicutes bacterium HGW-Firmicutes-5]PKM56997.1 MAG: hypothetical protein CVU98_08365 [Firmicutes bacterium HGW-Firmicutes-3]PKM64721.1 MAG: hypothetical protein CVU96_01410 [Firmicutes bacterium HGW-Firmicutes-20]
MLYTIGDIAKMLGISTEGLRYYEECGIVTPKKRKGSSYRYYDTWDLHLLVSARSYRSLGFSLQETAEIINSNQPMDISGMLDAREKELEEAILLNLNLLKRSAQIRTMFQEYQSMDFRYRIENSPGFYSINILDEYSLKNSLTSLALSHEWITKIPFVFSCIFLAKDELEKGGDRFRVGLGIDEKFAPFLKVKEDDNVSYFPPRRSVYTTLPASSDTIFSSANLSKALDYISSEGLKLADDAFLMIFNIHLEKENHQSAHCVWLPIED